MTDKTTQQDTAVTHPYSTDPLRLPVVLIHGMHTHDKSIEASPLWGRIPEQLREHGNSVWFGNNDSWGDIDDSSHQINETIKEVLKRTGAPRVHVIAHSKGGPDARHAIHMNDIGHLTASFVTLASPNHGLRVANFFDRSRVLVPTVVAPVLKSKALGQGDVDPDPVALIHSMTTEVASDFLEANPDVPGVEYRAFGFVPRLTGMEKLNPRSRFIAIFDGDNDGIVPLWSTEGTNWTIVRTEEGKPFGHDDSYDLNERDVELTLPDGTVYANTPRLVTAVVDELDAIAAEKFADGTYTM